MLQQTRVAAVIPFYERFLDRFPDIRSLAEAKEPELLAAWAGLGYYSRVRNMQRAARQMAAGFPSDYAVIRELPGVGDYTAAAVSSIALNLPYAAVDGNVLRVLTRLSGDSGDISLGSTKKRITALAESLLDRERPGEFNQAMMELGATVCLPRRPQCLLCPVHTLCEAHRTGSWRQLPVKQRRTEVVRLKRTVYIVERDKSILLWRRPAAARKLAGFWELPEPEHLINPVSATQIGYFRHSITNHNYTFEVHTAGSVECRTDITWLWLSPSDLETSPVSTTVKKAFHLYQRVR